MGRSVAIDSEVLKVAHHGSLTSSRRDCLVTVSPAVAVISVREDNRVGHTHAEVVGALANYVASELVYTTRDSGTIEFATGGTRLWVKIGR